MKRRAKQMLIGADANGGLPSPPNCFVCQRPVEHVALHVRMQARREMNVPVWVCSPGASEKYPLGLVRHSYCAVGTERWMKHVDPSSESDREWARRFTQEGGNE